ncbi:MAG: KH domain-containing protein [Clostridia bacterium]|nr:KH domain-containing protein [Clostridia bacterium]
MRELVEYLVKQFVDEENFEILILEDGNSVEFKVLVDKDYIAKVIGKSGKTSRAIRSLVRAASMNSDKNYSVYIQER